MARVLPLVLWRQRTRLDLDRLADRASNRDERSALGYFLELAGQCGGDPALVKAAGRLATLGLAAAAPPAGLRGRPGSAGDRRRVPRRRPH